MGLTTIKMFAIDIDGVLLIDTFSPVLKKLVTKWGFQYTSEIERNTFSRPRHQAAQYIINYCKLSYSIEEILEIYFQERTLYLKDYDNIICQGTRQLLDILIQLDLRVICYGGFPKSHFHNELEDYVSYFEDYICTNEFRPGIKEITKDIYNYQYSEICFIDDVNTVAENAKHLNVPFIGVPSKETWSFQKNDMAKTGVRYLVDSINDINELLILRIDNDVTNGDVWSLT